jgi:hypothetical protein
VKYLMLALAGVFALLTSGYLLGINLTNRDEWWMPLAMWGSLGGLCLLTAIGVAIYEAGKNAGNKED